MQGHLESLGPAVAEHSAFDRLFDRPFDWRAPTLCADPNDPRFLTSRAVKTRSIPDDNDRWLPTLPLECALASKCYVPVETIDSKDCSRTPPSGSTDRFFRIQCVCFPVPTPSLPPWTQPSTATIACATASRQAWISLWLPSQLLHSRSKTSVA